MFNPIEAYRSFRAYHKYSYPGLFLFLGFSKTLVEFTLVFAVIWYALPLVIGYLPRQVSPETTVVATVHTDPLVHTTAVQNYQTVEVPAVALAVGEGISTSIKRVAAPSTVESVVSSDFGIVESEISDFGIVESEISEYGIVESEISEYGIVESEISEYGIAESEISEFGISEFGIVESEISESEVTNPIANLEVDYKANNGIYNTDWLLSQDANAYVVQVASSINKEGIIQEALEFSDAHSVAVFPSKLNRSGEVMYGYSIGVYTSFSEAQASVEQLDSTAMREGIWIRRAGEIQQTIAGLQ